MKHEAAGHPPPAATHRGTHRSRAWPERDDAWPTRRLFARGILWGDEVRTQPAQAIVFARDHGFNG